jgi:hypothetical protein
MLADTTDVRREQRTPEPHASSAGMLDMAWWRSPLSTRELAPESATVLESPGWFLRSSSASSGQDTGGSGLGRCRSMITPTSSFRPRGFWSSGAHTAASWPSSTGRTRRQGLELGPWIAEYARRTFGVHMLSDRSSPRAARLHRADGVVLQRLQDPRGSMSRALALLSQTPWFQDGLSDEHMQSGDHTSPRRSR